MKKVVTTILFALVCITINAQVEQIYKPIIMQLENGSDIKEYAVGTFNHSISLAYPDSTGAKSHSVYLSISLESLDKDLTEWVADPNIEKNGKIMIKDRKTGEIINEYSFKGATISSCSEYHNGYYSGSYMYEEQNYRISISISIKEYSINGTPLKMAKEGALY